MTKRVEAKKHEERDKGLLTKPKHKPNAPGKKDGAFSGHMASRMMACRIPPPIYSSGVQSQLIVPHKGVGAHLLRTISREEMSGDTGKPCSRQENCFFGPGLHEACHKSFLFLSATHACKVACGTFENCAHQKDPEQHDNDQPAHA